MKEKRSFEQVQLIRDLLRWVILIVPIAIFSGLMVALFMTLLEWSTQTRWQNPWLVYLLPLGGVLIAWLYIRFGKSIAKGNNLIIEEIHKPGGGVPARMTPMILFTTVLTHLLGGSAGREGTAVQMGGSISALFSRWYKIHHDQKRILLMCGMSAGFGAVFGTPVAGAIFALEVLAVGKVKYDALIPCLLASTIADITCAACGIHHTHYHIEFVDKGITLLRGISIDFYLLSKVLFAGMLFGLVGYLYSSLSQFIKKSSDTYIKSPLLIPVVAAFLVIGISKLLGTDDYLGLGVNAQQPNGISIVNAFSSKNIGYLSWFWKLFLTAITLNMGFKGGEVTPLFFIGATLGNTIAVITGSPIDLFAGIGFIAVFAGATNTPLASTIMGVELFGADHALYYAAACFMAYYFSGHTGIYHSQKIEVRKY